MDARWRPYIKRKPCCLNLIISQYSSVLTVTNDFGLDSASSSTSESIKGLTNGNTVLFGNSGHTLMVTNIAIAVIAETDVITSHVIFYHKACLSDEIAHIFTSYIHCNLTEWWPWRSCWITWPRRWKLSVRRHIGRLCFHSTAQQGWLFWGGRWVRVIFLLRTKLFIQCDSSSTLWWSYNLQSCLSVFCCRHNVLQSLSSYNMTREWCCHFL